MREFSVKLLLGVSVVVFGGLASLSQDLTANPDSQIAAALQKVSSKQIEKTVAKLVSFQTRSTLSSQDATSVAAGHGIGAAREWIRAEFERYSHDCGECLEVKTDSFTESPADRIPAPTQLTNVYAVMKGNDPERAQHMVLVTGHYDSRNSDTLDTSGAGPGANDDASGTSVSLECARVLSKMKFPMTIAFLTVAGEEQGLNGSSHFAKLAKSEAWNIEAVLNNDIVGGDRSPQQNPKVVRIFSEGVPNAASEPEIRRIASVGGENDSPSRELARYVAEVGRTYGGPVKPLLIFRLDRYLRGGDHLSFNQQGYAAVRLTEFRENFDHQHQNVRTENGIEFGDLPKFVNYEYVASVARLNIATLASLASAPVAPFKVHLVTKKLGNDSTLVWESSPGATGYELLWRNTSSPDWEHVQAIGSVTTFTSPLSKDNVIFAVRAVDAAGHRSIPVVPSPEN